VVEAQTSSAVHASAPQLLFRSIYQNRFDVAPDGERVLLLEYPDKDGENDRMEVVAGWFDELRHRVQVERK
jgi:hypothetical protein